MNREHIMAVLYDMAMVIGGEVNLKPLLTKTLQRLLYHTSFPAGMMFLDLPPATGDSVEARVELAIGDYELGVCTGRTVKLPAALLQGGAALREDPALLESLPCSMNHYSVFLRLPIDRQGVILLLAPHEPHSELPLASVFQPVMANLARAMLLCRDHEAYTAGIVAERDAARLGLERFRAAMDTSADSVFLIDPATQRFVDFNRSAERALGYTHAELLALGPADVAPRFTRDAVARLFGELLEGRHDEHTVETMHRRKDGSEFPVEIRLSALAPAAAAPLVIAVARDITRRRRAEEALRESEEKFRLISASAQDAILIVDASERIAYWNEAACRLFGYSAEQALGRSLHGLLAPAKYHPAYETGFTRFVQTGQGPFVGNTLEITALRRDGTEFPIELSVSAVRLHDQWHGIGIVRDISERKRAETALRKVNRALKTLSSGNEVLVRATDEPQLLNDMCRVITGVGGYRMAWVGLVEHDERKTVRPVAQGGYDEGYLATARVSWGEDERGQGPSGAAIWTRRTRIVRDTLTEPGFAPWRSAAAERGYRSVIALPLLGAGGEPFGALTIYAAETDAFDAEETQFLEELSNDLAYGIMNLRTRTDQRRSAEKLRGGLEDTIQAIAATVEMRDPYTAGHQRRVAQLAEAIGRASGLSEERVHGLRLAGTIHDLGKISVPADILSKPGRLNEFEMSLIRMHPASGHDILKDIEFPWPIAQMVLQHHERLDGSGYPQGLKGDSILPEAKILAVADVVESMMSYRPYRPGLGLEAALKEISDHRGTVYDPATVDACLKLFREQGFAFDRHK